jgi:hypothetical protein
LLRRFFKYKYIEDIEKDQLYNFYQAKDKCHELNSTLWEILDGADEWESVIRLKGVCTKNNFCVGRQEFRVGRQKL